MYYIRTTIQSFWLQDQRHQPLRNEQGQILPLQHVFHWDMQCPACTECGLIHCIGQRPFYCDKLVTYINQNHQSQKTLLAFDAGDANGDELLYQLFLQHINMEDITGQEPQTSNFASLFPGAIPFRKLDLAVPDGHRG